MDVLDIFHGLACQQGGDSPDRRQKIKQMLTVTNGTEIQPFIMWQRLPEYTSS